MGNGSGRVGLGGHVDWLQCRKRTLSGGVKRKEDQGEGVDLVGLTRKE